MAVWITVRVLRPSADAQFFFYEVKGSRKQPTAEQRFWLEQRAACGFLAAWFDDFDGARPTSSCPGTGPGLEMWDEARHASAPENFGAR